MKSSNVVFENVFKKAKKDGQGCVKHFESISKDDLTLIFTMIANDSNKLKTLQCFVWFRKYGKYEKRFINNKRMWPRKDNIT